MANSVYSGTIDGYGAGGYGNFSAHTNSKGGFGRIYDTVATSHIYIAAGITYTNSNKTVTTQNAIEYDVTGLDGTYNMYLYQVVVAEKETTALRLIGINSDRNILENKEPLQQYYIPVSQYDKKVPNDDVYIGKVVVDNGVVLKIEKQTLNLNKGISEKYTNACMPDYSAGVDISGYTSATNQFIAPCNGVINYGHSTMQGHRAYINDLPLTTYGSGATTGSYTNLIVPISKGETWYATGFSDTSFELNNKFFPMKGANNA